MKDRFCIIFAVLALLAIAPSLHAQAEPTATQRGSVEAGAGVLYLDNDYTARHNEGLTIWGDYNFGKVRSVRYGIDATLAFGGINTPDDIGENSYLIGPRFTYRNRRFEVYGKGLFGRGTITNQDYNTSSSFNVFGIGGGLDYRLARKYKVRVDIVDQKWPNFSPNTLSPLAVSVGVVYVIR